MKHNVLLNLNQTEQVLPETVDVSEYPHLQDLTSPEVPGYLQITMAPMVTDAHLAGALQGL